MASEIDIDKLFGEDSTTESADEQPADPNAIDPAIAEEAERFAKLHLPDEMQKLYAGMLSFTTEWSFITDPTPAVYPLKGKSVAKIFQMMQADPGFQRDEALGRFYQDLIGVILLMRGISTVKLIESLKRFELFDKKRFKEMRKEVNAKNRIK